MAGSWDSQIVGDLLGNVLGGKDYLQNHQRQLQNQQGNQMPTYLTTFGGAWPTDRVYPYVIQQRVFGYSERLGEAVERLKNGIEQDLSWRIEWDCRTKVRPQK